MKTAWVFAGGSFDDNDVPLQDIHVDDIVVGVDAGIRHVLSIGLVPTVIIGDFDSVDSTLLNDARLSSATRLTYPSRKDSSDLELALCWLNEQTPDRVVLLGVSGGRTDHLLLNWLLPRQTLWSFALELWDTTVQARVVTPECAFCRSVSPGQAVSLIALEDAEGVNTLGLEYVLSDADLKPGSTRGLSNICCTESVSVSVERGKLLVCVVRSSL